MNFDDYVNPIEEVDEREYEDIENMTFFLKDFLHKELCGSNQGAYCLTHHSIETRSTKKNHQTCVLFGPTDLKGNVIKKELILNLLGNDSDVTWENFLEKPRVCARLPKHTES